MNIFSNWNETEIISASMPVYVCVPFADVSMSVCAHANVHEPLLASINEVKPLPVPNPTALLRRVTHNHVLMTHQHGVNKREDEASGGRGVQKEMEGGCRGKM